MWPKSFTHLINCFIQIWFQPEHGERTLTTCTASKQVFLRGAWREEVPVEVFGRSLGSFLWRRGRRGRRSTVALGPLGFHSRRRGGQGRGGGVEEQRAGEKTASKSVSAEEHQPQSLSGLGAEPQRAHVHLQSGHGAPLGVWLCSGCSPDSCDKQSLGGVNQAFTDSQMLASTTSRC